MPGICGGIAQNIISKMSNALLFQNTLDLKDTFRDNSCEIAHISVKENLFKSHQKDNIVVFVDGYVFNTNEISEKFNLNTELFSQQIITAYQNNYIDTLLKFADGYFAGVLYDQEKQKLLLFSDRLGTRLLYYYHKNKTFLFCSEIRGFLALDFIDKEIDKKSLECFVNGGNNFYLLADNTYFKNIKLIKPASIVEFDIKTHEMNQHYYWTFQEIKPSNISYEDAIDKLHDLVEKAVLKRIDSLPKDKTILPLSGGLDSRLIFAILNNHHKMPPFIYTNGEPNCTDVKYARQLCKKYHYKHYINRPLSAENYLEQARESSVLTEGMIVFFEYGTYDFFPGKFLISGYVGDVIFGESFKQISQLLDQKMNADMAEKFYGKFSELTEYNDDYFNINKLEPSLFINRIRRYTAQMLSVDSTFNEQILPYIDNSIVDFIYSIPDEYRANNHLYSDMLLKYYPQYYKKLPWNRYNRPIQGKINLNNKFNLNYIIEKVQNCSFLSKKMKKSILKRINYHEWFAKKTFHIFQEELVKEKNKKTLYELYDNSVIKIYFDDKSWKEIKNNFDRNDVWKIALFLTTEFYFRDLKKKNII